jgi:uncharacterized protein (DUF1778 family)
MASKKKLGRPPMFEGGATRIGIKMSVADRELLERAAEKARRQFSDWCRLSLVDEAKRQLGIDPDATEPR